jgi:hypothetical protein
MCSSRKLCLTALIAILLPSITRAEEIPSKADFIRYVEGEEKGQLEVGLGTYTNVKGVTVDLVGAVHVGDAAYYQNLNERFETYDAVLYEMVGDPADFLDSEKEEQPNAIRSLQRMMMRVLDLKYQLDAIDYKATNFVHADLTLKEFLKLQKERGETIFTLIQNAMKAQLAAAERGDLQQIGMWQLIRAFTSGDSASALKLIVAEQFDQVESLIDAAEGGNETVLVTERNKQVIKVIQGEMRKGTKRMAVFYGAAHLSDLERRVLDLGFRKSKHDWLTAWDIVKPKPKPKKRSITPADPKEPEEAALPK